MAEIHHLQHGWVTPTISYTLSVLGSLLGLICAVRLRNAPTSGGRVWWLTLAALAIGGTGIWTMHFVAMLGFGVVGTPIRYDIGLTVVSAVLAIGTVGVGLAVALLGSGSARLLRILVGGVLAGLGVAGMHYTGMAAMQLNGQIDYATTTVVISVVIAVVAASVALWLAVTVRKTLAIVGSALIMGVAVNGMHFTGMAAMSVQPQAATGQLAGATATALLIPIGVAVLFGVLGLAYALMAAPTDEDRAGLAYIAARQGGGDDAGLSPSSTGFMTRPAPPSARPAYVPQQRRPEPRPDPLPEPDEATRRLPGMQPPKRTAPPSQSREPGSGTPGQDLPRRMPTAGSSWTFRDRADKK